MEEVVLQEENSVIVFLIVGIGILLLMATSLLLFFYFSNKKIIQKELEKKDLAISYQRDLLHATIETQEEERKRIAQDLHDAISAKLNVVSLSTNVLIDGNLDKKEEEQTLQHILSVTTNTLESSRRLAHNLLPPILENFGLQAAIEELCDEFISSKKLAIEHHINYNQSLSKSNELHLFRITQELLNNSVRHGEASKVNLSIDDSGQFALDYIDNGKGFDLKSIEKKKGIGLKNIESRVEILGGELSYESEIGNGATFNIIILKTPSS
ncbi:sensor histidine kinase [Aquimarina sp. MMG016]|uniref:sensor histidine kinase n=1 Tax=Aquimarina sp. MMG016 TaxID=2822690 RepID=UPI001B3A0E58|nr:sensor histidine kinase [Aquimarina sp. MMG016]MBQ4821356.1 sensor histidine kinase [Aquimarina sp. MMG016]